MIQLTIDNLTFVQLDVMDFDALDYLLWVTPVPVRITLTLQFTRDYEIGDNIGFRLRVDTSDARGIDGHCFRYYQKPRNLAGAITETFSGVCSAADMEELPVHAPEDDTSPAGFRLEYVDLVVDSVSIAFELWAMIKTQMNELVQTVKDSQTLETATQYTAIST